MILTVAMCRSKRGFPIYFCIILLMYFVQQSWFRTILADGNGCTVFEINHTLPVQCNVDSMVLQLFETCSEVLIGFSNYEYSFQAIAQQCSSACGEYPRFLLRRGKNVDSMCSLTNRASQEPVMENNCCQWIQPSTCQDSYFFSDRNGFLNALITNGNYWDVLV
ncbi:hypothetical protein D915_010362 [Fasciola hepatica]|uniref:Uncharacterized protein n=1 Tax=Fasciola hepatica TaxID=6192 RepID=A0A4E0R002_FASHE|nr:hypothetical protein D915_010362 [Fasciola hepatica]